MTGQDGEWLLRFERTGSTVSSSLRKTRVWRCPWCIAEVGKLVKNGNGTLSSQPAVDF